MYVLIPLLLSAICAFVNPFIGLFSIFTAAEIIIIFCVDINADMRIKQSLKFAEKNTAGADKLGKSGKKLVTAECILMVLFTGITIVVDLGVWLLASGRLTGNTVIMTPLQVVAGDELTISSILLTAGIILQIIALILSFVRRKQLIR